MRCCPRFRIDSSVPAGQTRAPVEDSWHAGRNKLTVLRRPALDSLRLAEVPPRSWPPPRARHDFLPSKPARIGLARQQAAVNLSCGLPCTWTPLVVARLAFANISTVPANRALLSQPAPPCSTGN